MGKLQKTEGARLLRKKIERLVYISKGTLERQQIAQQLGVDPNTLGHWLAERRRPTIDQVVRIKKLLRITVESWTEKPTQR